MYATMNITVPYTNEMHKQRKVIFRAFLKNSSNQWEQKYGKDFTYTQEDKWLRKAYIYAHNGNAEQVIKYMDKYINTLQESCDDVIFNDTEGNHVHIERIDDGQKFSSEDSATETARLLGEEIVYMTELKKNMLRFIKDEPVEFDFACFPSEHLVGTEEAILKLAILEKRIDDYFVEEHAEIIKVIARETGHM